MRPTVGAGATAALAAAHFGGAPAAAAAELISYEDRNFLLTDAAGGRRILKVHNSGAAPARLAAHSALMRHIAAAGVRCNVPLPALCGRDAVMVDLEGGQHALRLLSYLPGAHYADAPPSPALHASFGAFLARLSAACATFDEPQALAALRIPHDWAMHVAAATIRRHAPLVAAFSAQQRAVVLEAADGCDAAVAEAEAAGGLAVQPVHGDANELNVLVDEGGAPEARARAHAAAARGGPPCGASLIPAVAAAAVHPPGAAACRDCVPPRRGGPAARCAPPPIGAEWAAAPPSRPPPPQQVVGVIDFGDCCVTWAATEVAVALAYLLLLSPPPPPGAGLGGVDLAPAGRVLRAFLAARPLAAADLAVVPALLRCRLALSVTMGAHSAALMPSNAAYVLTTQAAGWALLGALRGVDDGALLGALLAAGGG